MTRARDEPPAATIRRTGAGTEESRAAATHAAPSAPAAATGTSRDRAKAERRTALLAAAARLFAERGFDGVTLEDIGAAVGVSGPAVYRHVAGKQALLGAILVDVSERLLAGGRAATDVARGAGTTADADPSTPDASTTADAGADTPSRQPADRRVDESPRRPAHPAAAPLRALVEFHVAFALAEASVIRVQDRDLDRLSPDDRRTVRDLQNAYVEVWTEALAREFPDAETPAERRVRALACFGLINSTPHSVRGVPAARVRPTLTRMALAALTA
ncbi:TetR/AcrR family transcriptional regulator [Microbacterium sp. VKM Ac-2923]|uniref:TetR/AcrR family transcriptional regulator n=1 Tax=Microbacterium sp. VKM Ac-2923 TaxID=2929476 RepID=UPI001FB3B1F8|nr:TetR/AcrR family transcriptional regulator [Microbacterium sp. VKM Ac-2923]MCJ1707255.1 TetR/AcrR family transcriptional regulator [Microbacterium sp. VKM Ac-2923]